MARRRKQRKRKSPEELARQYADEADLRARLDNLHTRIEEFSRAVEVQQPVRTLVQAYIDRRERLKERRDEFINTLGEVFSVNIRLHRQIEDLEFRLQQVQDSIARGHRLPPDSVQQPEIPPELSEPTALSFVLAHDAATRLSELRLQWATGTVEGPARAAFKRMYAHVEELSVILEDVLSSSERLAVLSAPVREQYSTVLTGLAEDFDHLVALMQRNEATLDQECQSIGILTTRRDDLLAKLLAVESNIGR